MTALKAFKFSTFAVLLGVMSVSLEAHAQYNNFGGPYGNTEIAAPGGYDQYQTYGYGQPSMPPPIQAPIQQGPYGPGYPRPMPPRGGGYGYGYGGWQQSPCQQARRELRNAQMGFTIALNNLNNIGSLCGNNTVCIFGYQNLYNQNVTGMQNAQQKVDRACSYGRPRPLY